MALKFFIYFAAVFVVFDLPGVAEAVFRPFGFVLNYQDSIHEWVFRSSLDRYATLIGMLSAYFHPNVESLLRRVNAHPFNKLICAACACVLCLVNYVWFERVYVLDKYAYNRMHPYTFFVPLFTFILVRNATPFLRRWHCALFSFLGKITLETYISQLHIYLMQDAKGVLVLIKGYPLLNFLLNSVIFVALSKVLFHATIALNVYIFPSDAAKMWSNIRRIVMGFVLAYVIVIAVDLTI